MLGLLALKQVEQYKKIIFIFYLMYAKEFGAYALSTTGLAMKSRRRHRRLLSISL